MAPDPSSSAARPWAPSPFSVDVRSEETSDTVTLVLSPQGPTVPTAFRPGQFNMVYAFGVGEAAISISGDSPARRASSTRSVPPAGSRRRCAPSSREAWWACEDRPVRDGRSPTRSATTSSWSPGALDCPPATGPLRDPPTARRIWAGGNHLWRPYPEGPRLLRGGPTVEVTDRPSLPDDGRHGRGRLERGRRRRDDPPSRRPIRPEARDGVPLRPRDHDEAHRTGVDRPGRPGGGRSGSRWNGT